MHTIEKKWDKLIELGVSEQTLQIVTDINGYSQQTMLDVLSAHTGYRSFEQLESDGDDNSRDSEIPAPLRVKTSDKRGKGKCQQ